MTDKIDHEKDLAICEAATAGPWVMTGKNGYMNQIGAI